MLFDDTFRTIAQPVKGEFKDRGSKFIAFAYPVTVDTEVKAIVAQLKAEHTRANHHCWAMRLGPDRSVFRVNDDGEPAGTAGRPILNILLSHNLTNVLVVVVRYFGGTLLGVPGLINAYKSATEEAVKAAAIVEKVVTDVYRLRFDYVLMNEVMRVIKAENLEILAQRMELNCELEIGIRKSNVERVLAALQQLRGAEVKWLR